MENVQISDRASGRQFWQDQQCVAKLLNGKRILIAATDKADADKTVLRLKHLLKGKTIIEEPSFYHSRYQIFINELSAFPEVSACSSRKYAGTLIYLSKEL